MVERMMSLGLSISGHGYHRSAWLSPDVPLIGPASFDYYVKMAQIAENAHFDMVFLADFLTFPMADTPVGTLGGVTKIGFEPLTLLAAISTLTKQIGLVSTLSTTFNSPFQTARAFASLDQLSGGRSGWNVVTSFQDDEAANYGDTHILDKSNRYERAQEFVDVVAGLWDSFDSDTFVRDRSTGVFFDPKHVRVLDHHGKYFQVKGPLNVERSPQGRPIIFQAGASPPGQELAARTADVVYAAQNTIEDARTFYAELKARVPKYGRRPEDIRVLPGILPVLGSTQAEAKARFDIMRETIDIRDGLRYLYRFFGDLTRHPLDGPVPELRTDIPVTTRGDMMIQLARRNKYTIRQLIQNASIATAHHVVVGTPRFVADTMQEWFETGACDGFNFLPAFAPTSLLEFVDQVVPILQQRRLFRDVYQGGTLREHLGLPEVRAGQRLPERLN